MSSTNLETVESVAESILLIIVEKIVKTTGEAKSVDDSRIWYRAIIVGIASLSLSLFLVTTVVIIAYMISPRQSLSINASTSKIDSWSSRSSRDTVSVSEKDAENSGQRFHGVQRSLIKITIEDLLKFNSLQKFVDFQSRLMIRI